MSVQDWGAIGELISAIAVLITLVYLTKQIRHGNRSAENDSRHLVLSNFFEKAFVIAQDSQLRQTMRAALVDYESLGDDEKNAMDMFQMFFWGNLHQALILRDDKLLDDESFRIIATAFVGSINTPGGIAWWESTKKTPGVSQRVIKFVQDELSTTQNSWMDLEHNRSG